MSFTEGQIKNLKTASLPVYTILCPLYKEAAVLPEFVKSISNLDWPKNKLDVLLLLEEDDTQTQTAAKNLDLPSCFRVVIVPKSQPKTKPKACNYGLNFAKGDYLVIYDAEDKPDPQQLKKAYLGFQQLPPEVVCLQAKLNYYNSSQNLLTRLFTSEYSLWFDVMLPGYQSINTAIPLGGTSNHFRISALRQIHGWDAFNVTEDCDLGARLFKLGFRTALIDSTTLEEANSKLGNWLRQRSRWIKGYLQTLLVHNRHPLRFIRTHGIHAFIFQLVVGGKTAFMIINPILWLATISYFVAYRLVGPTIESLYPAPVFYMAGFSAVIGNFLFLYYYMIGLAKRGQWDLIKYVFFIPVYWLFVSLAALKAFFQLIVKPHYWEKTHHGLHVAPIKTTLPVQVSITVGLPQPKLHLAWPDLSKYSARVPYLSFFLIFPWLALEAYTIYRYHTQPEITLVSIFLSIFGYAVSLFSIPLVLGILLKLFRVLYRGSLLGAGLLIFSALVGNVCGFLYNAALGRSLSPADFGVISLMASFFYIVSLPAGALAKTSTHKNALLAGKSLADSSAYWRFLRARILLISLVFSFGWVLISPLLSQWFKSETLLPFLLFMPVWLATFTSAVDYGFLSGNLRFGWLAVLTLLESLSKLALALIGAWSGQLLIIYLAIPLAQLINIFGSWLISRRLAAKIIPTSRAGIFNFPYRFFFTSLLSGLSTVAFLSLDVILVKLFFSSQTAGSYALLSLSGKIIYFATSLVSQFIIPTVSHIEGRGENSRLHFYKLLSATAGVALVAYLVIGPAGFMTMPLLFGQKAVPIIQYLSSYGLGIVGFSLALSLVNFHQARKQYVFSYIGLLVSAVQVIGISLFHSSLAEVVWVVSLSGLLYLALVLVLHFNFRRFSVLLAGFTPRFSPRKTKQSTLPISKEESYKILIFNWRDIKHRWAGGAEVYLHELAKRWVKEGHTVTIFCSRDRRSLPEEIIDGVRIVRKGNFFTVYLWAPLYYLLRLRESCDILIDSENGVPFFTPVFSRKPQYLLIHHIHQEVFRSQLIKPLAVLAELIETKLMPFFYRDTPVITVSNSSRSDIIRIGLAQPQNIYILSPGIDLDQFAKSPKTVQPTFVYIGRIRPYKNIDIAIQSVGLLVNKYPDIKLHIAGWGENITGLKQLVQQLKLTKNVIFHGRVSETEKTELLGKSWAMIQPSSFEGWGITVTEANACGTLVIASDVIGLRDSVVPNQTGLLIPVRDAQAFSYAMEKIILDSSFRKYLSDQAHAFSLNYSWDIKAREFLELLKTRIKLSTSAGLSLAASN